MANSKLVSSFNERLKELMKVKKLKQVDICKATGISKSMLSQYINKGFDAKVSNVKKIAEAYKINPLWLMGFDVDMARNENLQEKIIERVKSLNNEELEKLDKFMGIFID